MSDESKQILQRIERLEKYIWLTANGMPAIKAYRELWEKKNDTDQ